MRWTLKPKPNKQLVETLQKSLQVDEITATLLVQRGIKSYEDAKSFFRPSLDEDRKSVV